MRIEFTLGHISSGICEFVLSEEIILIYDFGPFTPQEWWPGMRDLIIVWVWFENVVYLLPSLLNQYIAVLTLDRFFTM